MRILTFEVPVQRFDPDLIGRVPGRPKCCAMTHIARNSRVDPGVIRGPLSDRASSTLAQGLLKEVQHTGFGSLIGA